MKQFLVWFIALSLTFAAGFFTHQSSEKEQASNLQLVKQSSAPTNDDESHSSSYFKSATQISNIEERQNASPDTNTQLSFSELTAELELFASNKTGGMTFSEISRLYLLVADLSEEQLLELTQKFSIDDIRDSNPAFSVLFSKYVELAPQAALDFVLTEMHDESLQNAYITRVLISIATQDPVSAYEHFLQFGDASAGFTNRKQQALNGSLLPIFQNLAEYDRALAIDKLTDMNQQGYDVSLATMGLTQAFESQQEYTDLLAQLQPIDNNDLEDTIISQWTRHNPEQVGAWLTQDYQGSRYNEIQQSFVQSWAHIDREKSADWMITNSQPDRLEGNVKSFMQSWGHDNPEEAMQWFSQQSAAVYNQDSISDFLRGVAFFEPQFATNYLSFIDDEKGRSSVAQSIYQGLKRTSTSKAEAFLEQSPFRQEILDFDALMNEQ